jgi:hypothetical protein
LEIVGDKAFALIADQRLELPNNSEAFDAYFDTAQTLVKDPAKIIRYREVVAEAMLEDQQQSDASQAEQTQAQGVND